MLHTIEFFMYIPIWYMNLSNFIQYSPTELYYNYKNGIKFTYNCKHYTLTITTTAEAVLGKIDITLGDYTEYMKRIKKIITEVIGRNIEDNELILKRIDYKVDIKLTDTEMKIFKQLKDKHYYKYKYMSSKTDYETSVHLDNKSGQTNINSYDKYEESQDIRYWNIWRIEVQVKKAKLRKNLIRYGIERTLENYWNIDSFNENYFDFLQDYFFLGDYYRLDLARELIRKSPYSKTVKVNLCKFVTKINKVGMTCTKEKYNYNYVTMKKYIDLLNNIGVNPVTINNDSDVTFMENMLTKSRKVVNEKYFV